MCYGVYRKSSSARRVWRAMTPSASACVRMKNETGSNASNLPTKEQVIETVIDILVRTIGFIERKEVFPDTDIDKDFYIDTDDLTIFLIEIEKHFSIKPAPKEWFDVGGTIKEIADFVLHHLSSKR